MARRGNRTSSARLRFFESLERRLCLSTLTGTVFDDTNANDIQDAVEPGIAGARVYLDDNDNKTFDAGESFLTTGSSGAYSFTGLGAGNYNVRIEPPPGHTQLFPAHDTLVWDASFDEQPLGSAQTQSLAGSLPYTRPTQAVKSQQSAVDIVGAPGDLSGRALQITGSSSDSSTFASAYARFAESPGRDHGIVTMSWKSLVTSIPSDSAHAAEITPLFLNTSGFHSVFFFIEYGPSGHVLVDNQPKVAYSPGVANLFEFIIDMDARQMSLSIDGTVVSTTTVSTFYPKFVGATFSGSLSSGTTGNSSPLAVDDFTYTFRETQLSYAAGHVVTLGANQTVSGKSFALQGPSLSLSFGPTVSEGNTITGTVTRSLVTTSDLQISLQSNDVGEATVPSSVIIPANQASATFTLTGVVDDVLDGTQPVVITASATSFRNAVGSVNVTDDGHTRGELRTSSQVDTYPLSVKAGDRITIGDSSVYDVMPRIELVDPLGQKLQMHDDGTRIYQVAPRDGVYQLRVSAGFRHSPAIGAYDISGSLNSFIGFNEVEPNNAPVNAQFVTSGAAFRGSLSAGDIDMYAFNATAGQTAVFKFADRAAANPAVRVVSPAGSQLALDDTGAGLAVSLPASGQYHFEITGANAAGDVSGGYAGFLHLENAVVKNTSQSGFAGAPVWDWTTQHAVGVLSKVGELDVFAVDLTEQSQWNLFIPFAFNSLFEQGRQLVIFNDRGQQLMWRAGRTLTQSATFSRWDFSGRHFVGIRAVDPTGIGGYSLGFDSTSTFPAQRDVPLYWHDFQGLTTFPDGYSAPAYERPELIPLLLAMFESQWDNYDVDVTLSDPGSGREFVTIGIGNFNNPSVHGIAFPQTSVRSINGKTYVDIPVEEFWNSLIGPDRQAYIASHELSHMAGLGHEFSHPLASVGSAVFNQFIVGTVFPGGSMPDSSIVNPRSHLDLFLQSGRIAAEVEGNDTPATGQSLDPYFAEMVDGTPRNDRVTILGSMAAAGDVDQYTFTVSAGEKVAIDLESAEFQQALHADLKLYDAGGVLLPASVGHLDRETGIVSADPYMVYQFAQAGTYRVSVSALNGTSGSYRLKITPQRAWDDAGPRVIATDRDTNGRRQLLFYFNDKLDPATLTNNNIVVTGQSSGVRSGQAYFDVFSSTLIWTADQTLPPDTYTVRLEGGSGGIADLRGNLLDGETDGTFAFPELSGNGSAGGDFVMSVQVNASPGESATVLQSSSTNIAGSYGYGDIHLSFSKGLDYTRQDDWSLRLRGPGADRQFNTADDEFLPFNLYQDLVRGTNELFLHPRGYSDVQTVVDMRASVPQDVVLGDFNNDSIPDLAAANPSSAGEILLSFGRGGGLFDPETRYSPVGGPNYTLVTNDFNEDGNLDLAFPCLNDNQVGVMFGRGDGTFEMPVYLAAGDEPSSIVSQDMNDDGNIDLIVGHEAGKLIRVYYGAGNGTFPATADLTAPGELLDVVVSDLNGDGRPDLAGAHESTDGFSVWTALEDGFSEAQTTTLADIRDLAAADLTGDQVPDLVTTIDRPLFADADLVRVWKGLGGGTFQQLVSTGVGKTPEHVAIADLNHDGDLDVVTTNLVDNSASILLGNGAGGLTLVYTAVLSSGYDLEISDVNGDSHPDLVVADGYANGVSILLGNGDGTFRDNKFRIEGTVIDERGAVVSLSEELIINAPLRSPSIAELNVRPNSVTTTALNTVEVTFSMPVNTATLTPANFKLRYSPDATFFNGNDATIADADGIIQWDATLRKAIFRPASPLGAGFYLVELEGEAGGITGRDGRLIDGEYQDAFIQGNPSLWKWDWVLSGDGIPGGDYRAAFSIVSPLTWANFGGSASYTENASAAIVDGDVVVGNPGGVALEGATLTVQINTGFVAGDILAIRHQGNGAAQIGVAGNVVSMGGVALGTFSGGTSGAPLVVTFNATATTIALQRLFRNLTFRNTGNNPTAGGSSTRALSVTLAAPILGQVGNATKTINVTPLNDAPVLNTGVTVNLNPIAEDSTPAGTLVSSLLGGITDVDAGAVKGIAVSSANNIAGTWQYTLDGTNWLNFGTVSRGAVRLLPANATARVRLLPKANFNGTASLWFFAWDQTSGTPGGTANLTPAGTTGGTTAFSTAVRQAFVSVTPVNDAPKLNTGVAVNLNPIAEDSTPAGTLVSSLLGGITDVDAGALKGIAVSSANNIAGTWQYTLDGTNWLNFGAVSRGAVRLLPADATTRVRLLPKANFNGTASIWFFAWDRTSGSPGGAADLTPAGTTGGTTAFSTVARQAFLSVTPVNDAPVLGISGSLGYTRNAPPVVLAPNATVTDVDSTIFDGGELRVWLLIGGSSNTLAVGSGFSVDQENNVFYGTTLIGIRTSSGIGTSDLKIQFNSSATKAIVQQLVRSITYRNVGGSAGTRTVAFTVSDGDGGLSQERLKTVNVT